MKVHPVDLLTYQESGLVESMETTHASLHWEADAGMDEGDWVASTDEGAVLRIRTEILAALRERLDLPAAL